MSFVPCPHIGGLAENLIFNKQEMKLNPKDFNQMISRTDTIPTFEEAMDAIRATREFQSVPEEVMAEQAVRESLSKVSPEVREKIRDGKPF